MWWRVLGVAVVLLALGVAGGYALGSRTAPEPVEAGVPDPVPAVSPAVPTPPVASILPDPDVPVLEPDLPLVETELRIRPRAAGIALMVPEGWRINRLPNTTTWTLAVPGSPTNAYNLRIAIVLGNNFSVAASKSARLGALADAVKNEDLSNFVLDAQTADTFEATYVDGGFLRVTAERWVSFNGGATAYADIATTGRSVDREGLRDLLVRVAGSARELPPIEKEPDDQEAP